VLIPGYGAFGRNERMNMHRNTTALINILEKYPFSGDVSQAAIVSPKSNIHAAVLSTKNQPKIPVINISIGDVLTEVFLSDI